MENNNPKNLVEVNSKNYNTSFDMTGKGDAEQRKMTFVIGAETKPIVLSDANYEASPFVGVLNKSLSVFSEFIRASREHAQLVSSYKSSNYTNVDYAFSLHPEVSFPNEPSLCKNNIISFIGERGSGKSSCLLSFRNIVLDKARNGKKDLFGGVEFMSIIDPSFFDSSHNILEIFIGELFRNYRAIIEKSKNSNPSNEELTKRKKLKSHFSKVKRALQFLDDKSEDFDDEHAELLRLSDGVNLEKVIGELITDYLDFIGKELLVVSVDDIDLHAEHAYEMAEQIRKYLLHWNVVVLLAAKYDQLQLCITRHLIQSYKDLLDKNISFPDIIVMAERYIDKFLPLDQRMYMPQHREFYQLYALEIVLADNPKCVVDRYDTIELAVLSLIFQKCGYLFYNTDNESSLIIPRNLRELRQLVTLLYNMPDRYESKSNHDINKALFKNYFYGQWIQTLPNQHRLWLKSLVKESNFSKINKLVVSHLFSTFDWLQPNRRDDGKSDMEESTFARFMAEISDPLNQPENISLGDVNFVLNRLNDIADSDEVYRLVFFLRSHYSILLYEAYDRMTSRVPDYLRSIGIPELRSARAYVRNDFFRIVGNSFFLLSGQTFLPKNSSGESRELVLIDGSRLWKEIGSLLEEFTCDKYGLDLSGASQEMRLRFNLVEFFILSTSRRVLRKSNNNKPFNPDKYDKWRSISYIDYFDHFTKGTKNLLFDVTAPFVNCIDLRRAYFRFDKRFYFLAYRYKYSLLNKILNCRHHDGDVFTRSRHSLMSRVAIRNMEVLNDLDNCLGNERYNLRPKSNDDLGVLQCFYSLFGDRGRNYSIKTYAKSESDDDSYITINFHPIGVLADFLNEILPTRLERIKKLEKLKDLDIKTKNDLEEYDNAMRTAISLFSRIYRDRNKIYSNETYVLDDVKAILQLSEEKFKTHKSKILENIFGKVEEMSGINIANSLAEIDLDKESIFKDIFDDALYKVYRGQILDKFNGITYLSNERLTDLKTKKRNFQNESTALNKQLDSITTDSEGLKKTISQLHKNIALLNLNKTELEDEIKQIQQNISSIRHRLEIAINERLGISDINSYKFAEMSELINRYEVELKGYTNQLTAVTSNLEECKDHSTQAKIKLDEYKNVEEKAKSQIQDIKERLITLKHELEENESMLEATKAVVASNQRLEKRINSLLPQ